MNELTWRRVLEWEALHHDTCGDPKLLRFMGKPHDLRYIASYTVYLWHCAFMAGCSICCALADSPEGLALNFTRLKISKTDSGLVTIS